MNVTSGARRERLIRNGIFVVMCLGIGGWFAYDGWVKYEAENFERNALQQLPVEHRDKADPSRVYPSANQDRIAEIAKALDKAAPTERRAELKRLLGGPPTFESDSAIYYFGQDAAFSVDKTGNKLSRQLKAAPAEHTLTSIRMQKALGVILGAVGIGMLVFLFRVARARAAVTDAGLSINGAAPIPFGAMRRFDDSDFRQKGRVDLIYGDDGNEKCVTLDEYHFDFEAFPQIIAAISEKTGFTDPVAQEKAEKSQAANTGP